MVEGAPPPSPFAPVPPLSVISPVTARLTGLLERMAADTMASGGTGAAALAKEEFLSTTGRVHEGDAIFEMRMAQFTEWYLLDRPQGGADGPTPCERWLEARRDGLPAQDLADALALAASHRAILCWAGRAGPGKLLVDDPLSGIRWEVTASAPPPGLSIGDVFDARLAAVQQEVHFTGAFCYHPPELAVEMRRSLERLARLGRRGQPANEVLSQLLAWRLAYDRSEGIPARDVYHLDRL
ncbi:MAG: hypothetical protein RBU30_17325 [Polyangia bacterium]|jgi:hypothetical protein|nr:hypothetical protein [Polyangia bacterium]